MRYFSDRVWYTKKRDRPLSEYLKTHDGHYAFHLFKGYRHYKMLWDYGHLEPDISVVRVM